MNPAVAQWVVVVVARAAVEEPVVLEVPAA